jgi:hypothetical protein
MRGKEGVDAWRRADPVSAWTRGFSSVPHFFSASRPFSVLLRPFFNMAAGQNAFDMQIKLLMIGDSGEENILYVFKNQ